MTIEAHNVGLERSGVTLLSGIDLTIHAGAITTVLGPNGAGKTSLLRSIAGELQASGEITLGGTPVREWSASERAKRLAILPQHSLLDFPFTAEEVVQLGRMPHASGLSHDRDIVRQALALVDGHFLANREYTRLSGGEKQRVHFARVLAQIWEPLESGDRFLLLDEPTSSFDLAHQRMTVDIVKQLRLQGVGVMMILHDLNLAAKCADHMVLMQCGQVSVSGSPCDVLTEHTVKEVFQVEAHVDRHPRDGAPLVII
ncbi:MAG: heme ABC transporter ATP-binding protein [Pseudomonadota bacterium]